MGAGKGLPQWYRTEWPIIALLLVFVALGVLYALVTPPFEAPDEPGHYAYVRYLAEQGELPPLVISSDEWEQGQMHQPPLYYLLGALLVGQLDSTNWQVAYPPNPYSALGIPHTAGNVNAVLHPIEPSAEALRAARAVRLLRGLSLACSAATVWMTFRLANQIAPGRRWLALGAAALLALNPQFLFISASINNDLLVTMLATAVLLLSTKVAMDGGIPFLTPIMLGFAAGLAAIAKLSGLASLALIPCAYFLFYRVRSQRQLWDQLVRPLLICGSTALAVGGWWYLRNFLSYGDPLGMRHYSAIFAVRSEPMPWIETALTAIEALPSYWGVFGWMNILAPEAFYVGVRVLTVMGIAGLLLHAFRAWRQHRVPGSASARALVVILVWLMVMGLLILQWTQTITRTQGRLIFPASAAISFLLALGLFAWIPRHRIPIALAGLGAGLLLTASAMPWLVIAPAYALPQRITLDTLPSDLARLDIRYGEQMVLLGAELMTTEAIPGDKVWMRLYWLAEDHIEENYTIGMQLLGLEGERLGGLDTLPGMGLYPTIHWRPGEVLVDDVAVQVNRDASGPVAAALHVSLYEGQPEETLLAHDPAGTPLGYSPQIGRVRLAHYGPAEASRPAVTLSTQLGTSVLLQGYDLQSAPTNGQQGIELFLYWESLEPMSASYTVFVHLLDVDGKIISQADAPPLQGGFPTEFWRPGDRVQDSYRMAVPPDAEEEPLRLRVGLYHSDTGERLPVINSDPNADYVETMPFEISAHGALVFQDRE